MGMNYCSPHSYLLTKRLWIMVENCGKIIDKKHTLNLESSKARTFKQESQITKKVSPFLIMTFQRHFSQVFA